MKPSFFYGWLIVVTAGLCYGFGMSPVYYSWSIFAPSLTADLGIGRGDVGGVFGLFTALFQSVGVLVGLAIVRFGLRSVMVAGFCTTTAGLLFLSTADSALDCYIGFSILGGIGVGFSTIVPAQTLGQNWFLRRRALVIGVIFAFGGVVGWLVAPVDAWVLEHYQWRIGWIGIAGVSMVLALLAGALVRETPESMGQVRDGAVPPTEGGRDDVAPLAAISDRWTAAQAVRTPQFALMLVCGVAYSAPFNTAVAHLTLHLTDVGHPNAVAIGLVGTMALISIGGRVMGAAGDWISPQWALAVALALEGLGAGGLLLAADSTLALVAVALIGLGFGMAYISVPVVFSHFFGRKAFSVTTGIRMTITGVLAGLGPWLAGLAFDATGSYTGAFVGLMLVCWAGGACAAAMRHPGSPPAPSLSP